MIKLFGGPWNSIKTKEEAINQLKEASEEIDRILLVFIDIEQELFSLEAGDMSRLTSLLELLKEELGHD